MHIEFPGEEGSFNGANVCVDFIALVDGREVPCSITAEALEDHFGANSAYEWDLLAAFRQGRERIHKTAVRVLEGTDGDPVVLRSGLFRITALDGN